MILITNRHRVVLWIILTYSDFQMIFWFINVQSVVCTTCYRRSCICLICISVIYMTFFKNLIYCWNLNIVHVFIFNFDIFSFCCDSDNDQTGGNILYLFIRQWQLLQFRFRNKLYVYVILIKRQHLIVIQCKSYN